MGAQLAQPRRRSAARAGDHDGISRCRPGPGHGGARPAAPSRARSRPPPAGSAPDTSPPTTGHRAAADASATPCITPRATSPFPDPPGTQSAMSAPIGDAPMAARSLTAPMSAFHPTSAGVQSERSTCTPSTTLSTETTSGPPSGDLDQRGVVPQAERLDSVSQHPPNKLQEVVLTGDCRQVRWFGGSHGSCLALDPTETGPKKEQIPQRWRRRRTRISWLGSRRWPH